MALDVGGEYGGMWVLEARCEVKAVGLSVAGSIVPEPSSPPLFSMGDGPGVYMLGKDAGGMQRRQVGKEGCGRLWCTSVELGLE